MRDKRYVGLNCDSNRWREMSIGKGHQKKRYMHYKTIWTQIDLGFSVLLLYNIFMQTQTEESHTLKPRWSKKTYTFFLPEMEVRLAGISKRW
jgi:hypothetical protein